MFAQLLASRPARRRSPAGFAASLVVHSLVIAGAVALTTRVVRPPEPHDTLIQIVAPPAPKPLSAAPQRSGTPVWRQQFIDVPIRVPDGIPPIDLLHPSISLDDPLQFRVGAPPVAPGVGPVLDPSAAFTEADVEVPVVVDPRSALPRYPQWMRDAGIEGSARARFIVDSTGRAEMATMQIVSSTHTAFAEALRMTLPAMRFVPARIGGRRVRQLVEFPVEFRLNR